jgi:predicted molibdopterin-dependent oxidoreductase YjgC
MDRGTDRRFHANTTPAPRCWVDPDYIVLAMDDGIQRLTQPLVRDGGRLVPASWDEALARAAAGFDKARSLGPNAFGMFSCSKTTNELNFMAQKFTRVVMHSNNVDSCNRT